MKTTYMNLPSAVKKQSNPDYAAVASKINHKIEPGIERVQACTR